MKVNEDLSILFWLKRQKATKEGLVPIYVRITVKGGRTEFPSGKKVHPDYWDEESATALSWVFRRYVTLCSVAKLTTCLLAKKCSLCFSSINKDNYLPISI